MKSAECRCPSINCNRHLGYGLDKSGSTIYCKACRNYIEFKTDGSKRIHMPEFLPKRIAFQDRLSDKLVKK